MIGCWLLHLTSLELSRIGDDRNLLVLNGTYAIISALEGI